MWLSSACSLLSSSSSSSLSPVSDTGYEMRSIDITHTCYHLTPALPPPSVYLSFTKNHPFFLLLLLLLLPLLLLLLLPLTSSLTVLAMTCCWLLASCRMASVTERTCCATEAPSPSLSCCSYLRAMLRIPRRMLSVLRCAWIRYCLFT